MKSAAQIMLLILVAIVAAVVMAAITAPLQVASADVAEEYEFQLGRQAANLRALNEYEAQK